jgi:tetratricopeptide (TPR) repeat protein
MPLSEKKKRRYSRSPVNEMDPRRKRIFTLIAVSIPILFFLVLEIGLRIFDYGGNTDLFIPGRGDYSEYMLCNRFVGRRFFSMQTKVPDPPNDLFLKQKPEDGYRIFVLGGSTAAGYPYGNNMMFSRILHQRLEDTFPDRTIEVVNVSTAAINSYALLDFMDEIIQNKPDAILIYAGHNEFYGALGVASAESFGKSRPVIRLYLGLQSFKTFRLVRNAIGRFSMYIGKLFNVPSMTDPTATLMERLVAEQTIPSGSSIYESGKKQFEANLLGIMKKAKGAGIPIAVSELVSNIGEQEPFISVETEEYPPADRVYLQARAFRNQQRFEEAKQAYYRAKDLDALRFRAHEEFNDVIRDLVSEFDAALVPMKSFFEAASPNGIIGKNLMLEHLHPNIDGYFIMADAFYEAMRESGFIASDWGAYPVKPASFYRKTWGVTPLDSLYGDLRIRVLKGGWPFKPKSAPNRSLRDYHATTKPESLVVQVWSDYDFTLERAHVMMAEHYEKRGEYNLAYQEYKALIYLTPFNVSPYIRAVNMLILQGDLASAMPLLRKSLDLEASAFANKWIGQILLNENRLRESLPYLKKAYSMRSDDPQLLYNLSGAYALNAQYEKARDTLDELYRMAPNFPDTDQLKRQLDRILDK